MYELERVIAELSNNSEARAGVPFTVETGGAWMEGVYTGLALALATPETVEDFLLVLEDGAESILIEQMLFVREEIAKLVGTRVST